jgi:hypothetical protein
MTSGSPFIARYSAATRLRLFPAIPPQEMLSAISGRQRPQQGSQP